MPHPPAQTTITPALRSCLIVLISRIRRGAGEGTARRHSSPSQIIGHDVSAAGRCASASEQTGTDRLAGSREGRVGGIGFDLRQQGRDIAIGQLIRQGQVDQVADHSLALRAKKVEGIGLHGKVGTGLQRQKPDLRAIAVS